MESRPFSELADLQFVYLTTTGRTSGALREIEIWFVMSQGKVYSFAEHGHAANWVRNILQNGAVRIRLGSERFDASARVIDCRVEDSLCAAVRASMQAKYGWSDGLPVEISPIQ